MRMRTFVAGQEAFDDSEFAELAFGFDEFPLGIVRDLFCGPLGEEEPEDEELRLDVAREVLRDLREQGEAGDEIAAWDAIYADALTAVVPLRRTRRGGRSTGTGAAA
ncbi:hypothetical protein [Streptomyces noursei]|uniref:hypothetical protein n=1 Tax=Streptomyces noursei TaxID=1971 RepID=UPI0030F103D0